MSRAFIASLICYLLFIVSFISYVIHLFGVVEKHLVIKDTSLDSNYTITSSETHFFQAHTLALKSVQTTLIIQKTSTRVTKKEVKITTQTKPKTTSTKTTTTTTFSYIKSLRTNCGLKTKRFKRIKDGENAEQWPWDVRIVQLINKARYFIGSGTIIHSKLVIITHDTYKLTNMYPGQTEVVIRNNQVFLVKEAHKLDYGENIFSPNFVLLVLEKPIKFDSLVGHICLPEDDFIDPSKEVYITGWSTTSKIYEQGRLKILSIDTEICANNKNYDLNFHYCAKSSQGSKVITCNGDSNLYYEKNGKWYIYGVLDRFGLKTDSCAPNQISYFTKLYRYLSYFEEIIRDKCN
ncbi:unnamed protein product [Brachionus calyciflorus]|uniref:Peptidase S1 domain-containing protein n=1 Tax=Brachionus calyciflorus TaxID=104777 RepID=A0A813QHQ9_9BILA|nr:unnamed protein product [Brachionus calyciflorus]